MTDHTYAPRIDGPRFVVGDDVNPTRTELHFGNRVFRCYAKRPERFDDLLRRAARDMPENEALVYGDTRLTYAQYDTQVTRVANGLLAAGIEPGDRVGLMLGNGIAFFLALMGTVRMGGIAVPMSVKMSPPETAYILNHCTAAGLITEAAVHDRLPPLTDCPSVRVTWSDGAGSDGPETDRAGDDMLPFQTLLDGPTTDISPVGSEDDTVFLFYTSGTTGKPKGACIANINIIHSALQYAYGLDLKPGQRGLLAIPGAHISGFMALYTNMLSVAGATVILRDYKTATVLDVLQRERITFTVFVPAIYQLILMHDDFDASTLTHWRTGIYGGGIMPPAIVTRLGQALPDLRLINAYGATETTSPVSIMPAWASADRPASIGLLVECGEAVIMGEDGIEVDQGDIGELWVRGPMIIKGYWDAPEQTAENFLDGFWRTGDVVSMDGAGYLFIHDRKKDMINRAGYKVFSAEVENVMIAHPDVVECAAVPVPDVVMGERVCIYVTVRDARTDEDTLRAHAAKNLSDYKQPDYYRVSTDALPRNANGKMMKAPLVQAARDLENCKR
ncbi:class I adenylate-forming enzyme family protein [Rhodobacteraceae bacterium KMM 6894]|nr:class I adenylate-forming enzyme family protein [Rhodobacteraceae bacterium KMM 6894]